MSDEISLSDLVATEFLESGDVIQALDDFARGFLAASDLKDILANELLHARARAESKALGDCLPDDPEARPGTCGADYRHAEREPVVEMDEIDEHEQGIPA